MVKRQFNSIEITKTKWTGDSTLNGVIFSNGFDCLMEIY